MAVATRPVSYLLDDREHEGLIAFDPAAGPRPLVLVFHTIAGRGENELGAARRLASQGYAALACDLYGKDKIGLPREECAPLMHALLGDRPGLQVRMIGILSEARDLPEVDPDRVAAIGFCFGGLCALDLARTGINIRGAASFHGLLTPPGNTADIKILAKVIVFHGWDDPMAPPEDVEALGRELSAAGADWQVHAYGGTVHGFTNPKAADPEKGILYNQVAAERAWRALDGFLEECFQQRP